MIPMLSLRYAFSKSAHHRASSIRIMITVAISLTMVVVIISIMDFLQNSRFEEIRNVRSFDLVIDGMHKEEIKGLYPEATVFEYGEGEALIDGNAFLVRYVDDDYDGGIRIIAGDIATLAIPYSLYRSNNSQEYDVSILRKGKSGIVIPRTEAIAISGIYSSGMGQEFDSTTVFMPIKLASSNASFKTAIKGIDIKEKDNLASLGYDVSSWKDSESGLYSAFLIEKLMMYIVLAMLFMIILVSTRQSVRIFYREKRKERAELEVLGLNGNGIALSFLLSFLIVLLCGISIAFILSIAFLPILEKFCSTYIMYGTILKFPYMSFLAFSFIIIAITMLFSLNERRKDKIFDLVEVINAK